MKRILHDPESDTWTGIYTEYPGCISQGDTHEEAEINLDEALISWKSAAIALGQTIPGKETI